jgi:hypothetical protein
MGTKVVDGTDHDYRKNKKNQVVDIVGIMP